jgi:transposase
MKQLHSHIKNMAGQWVSRVPATLSESHDLLRADVALLTDPEDTRYSFYETTSQYGGVEQKWVLVHSAEMEKKMKHTFETPISQI